MEMEPAQKGGKREGIDVTKHARRVVDNHIKSAPQRWTRAEKLTRLCCNTNLGIADLVEEWLIITQAGLKAVVP